MFKCLLIYKSLTSAQYAVTILRSSGIGTSIIKAPRDTVSASCSYGVVCDSKSLDFSLTILSSKGTYPDRILTDFSGGN